MWTNWFEEFFAHIEKNKDAVRAVSSISAESESQSMWRAAREDKPARKRQMERAIALVAAGLQPAVSGFFSQ
ncbi:MAG: hypothetical protein RLZZ440_2943 [Planctomycetota bacterium]